MVRDVGPFYSSNLVIGPILTKQEPLYDSRGTLTPQWRKRIKNLEGDIITARSPRDLLDPEAVSNPKLRTGPIQDRARGAENHVRY